MPFRKMASVIFFEAVEIQIVEKFYKTQIKLSGKQILGIWYFKKEGRKIRRKNQKKKSRRKKFPRKKITLGAQKSRAYLSLRLLGRAY